MNAKILKLFMATLVIGLCFLLIATLSSTPEHTIINNEEVIPFNNNWSYKINDVKSNDTINLPHTVAAHKNDKVAISNTLPKEFTPGMTLCFRSVQQCVRVFINGTEIYQHGYNTSQLIGKAPGSTWNFVRLDNSVAGENITIEYVSPYEDYSTGIDTIQYGSKNANVFSIIIDNIVGFTISILIIGIGISLLVTHGFLRKHTKTNTLLYLGLFALLAGLWSLMETRMMQFFINDLSILVLISITSLMLITIPLLLFIAETHNIHNKKPFYAMCYLFIANFIINLFLQAFNIVDFIEFPYITQLLIIVSVLIMLETFVVETVKYKNKSIFILGIGSCILGIISLIDLVRSYNKFSGDYSYFFRFGVLLYILILSYNTIKHVIAMIAQNMRTDVLEQLAYVDLLTHLNNRTSFELALESYNKNKTSCDSLMIGIFDINNLKTANDTYGHKAGDELIISAANCLSATFGKQANIYRIGGDEFAIMTNSINYDMLDHLFAVLNSNISKANENNNVKLSLAYAGEKFDHNIDTTVDDLYARADKKMYRKKVIMKDRQDKDHTNTNSLCQK